MSQKKSIFVLINTYRIYEKIILILTAFLLFGPNQIRANEGMWFLMFIERLNQTDMEKMGLQLTAEEIYSINNHS